MQLYCDAHPDKDKDVVKSWSSETNPVDLVPIHDWYFNLWKENWEQYVVNVPEPFRSDFSEPYGTYDGDSMFPELPSTGPLAWGPDLKRDNRGDPDICYGATAPIPFHARGSRG